MKKMLTAVHHKLLGNPGNSLNTGDWLAKALGLCGQTLPAIREEIGEMMRLEHALLENDEIGRETGFVSRRVCSKLIRRTAMKAGAVGGITAAPAVLPVVGTVGTAIVGTAADFAYLIRKQVRLCYGISAVYDSDMDDEELKAVTLAIIGFSGTGQLGKEIAARTFKSVVDASATRFLKKGLVESAPEVAARITPKLLGRSYRLIPFLSIPLSASINMTSTMIIGNHARKYFSPAPLGMKGFGETAC